MMLPRLLTRFVKSFTTQNGCGKWAKRREAPRVTMIKSTSCGSLCESLRRRVQRESGGQFLERETCTGDGRGVVHWVDTDGSACSARGASAHRRRPLERAPG